MMTIKIIVISVCLGVLLFFGTCATTKTPLPTDNIEELLGTWINPDYEGAQKSGAMGKCIYKEDGTVEWYEYIKSGNPASVEYTDIIEKWIDQKGAVYFKLFMKSEDVRYESQVLLKVNSEISTLEWLSASRMEFLPSVMNPDAPYCVYYIWYRR